MKTRLNSILPISIALLLALLVIVASCQWLISNKNYGIDETEHNQKRHEIELSTDIEELRSYALTSSRLNYTGGNLIVSLLHMARDVAIVLTIIALGIVVLSFRARKNISNNGMQPDAVPAARAPRR